MKDDCKYGRYESVAPPSFQNQIFEGPDTDIETGNSSSLLLDACINFTCILEKFILLLCVTELQLCNARHSKPEDATEDDTPSTSGRQIYEAESSASSSKVVRASSLSVLDRFVLCFPGFLLCFPIVLL